MIHVTTWTGLKGIMLREKSQSQRLHTAQVHLHSTLEVTKLQSLGAVSGCQRLGDYKIQQGSSRALTKLLGI